MDQTLQNLIKSLPDYFIPEKAAGISLQAQLILSGEEIEYWSLLIRDQQCHVSRERLEEPELTLISTPEALMGVLTGKMDITRAYMQGKFKFSGSFKLAIKILELFDIPEEYQAQI